MNKEYSRKGIIASLVAPGVFVFLFAIFAPICLSVYYGFTNFSGLGSYQFVGGANYGELIRDQVFWRALRNSFVLGICFIVIQHPIALATAAVLDKLSKRAEGFFSCVYFLPNVISVAVIAYLWKFIYNPSFGLLNKMARMVGLAGETNWLGAGHAVWSIYIVLIWHGFGWAMLVYYTGIKNVDPALYEAAAMDGADGKTTFFHITVPLLKPVVQVNVTIAVISALKQMELVYLLTNGGPGNESQFLANYLYKQAFHSYRYGYGNAISVVFVMICVLATQVLNHAFKSKQEGMA